MRLKGDNALMSSAPESRDQQYLSLILQKIEVSKVYKPRFGQAREIALDEFRMLYGNDPFYSWFGLNNLFVYAAHKAAGGMTSLYRQIGPVTGSLQTASEHCLRQCGVKPTVLDHRNPSNLHMLVFSL